MLNRIWLLWALLPAATLAQGLPAGTQLSFRGSIAQLDRDRAAQPAQKSFDLLLIVAESEANKRVYWTIDERGRGAWPWVERFGSLTLDDRWQRGQQRGPTLLYDLGESKSAVPVTLPLLTAEQPLAAGLEWEEGPWKHVVQKATKLDDRDTWQVQISNSYGPKRTVWVAKDSPLAVGINERVFMGMGQEFQLELRLISHEVLPADSLATVKAAFDGLIEVRGRLNLAGSRESLDLTDDQRAMLAQALPPVEKQAAATPLERIVRAAQRDLGQLNDKAAAVSKLTEQQTGSGVPEFAAEGLNQESVSQQDLAGKVTVLHFWEYRDSPLQEPYGQIGYLDFLAQRQKAAGVKVYGVAVDGRLGDPAERSQALRGIRKLKAFMNLSYPILLDNGSLIRKFGDPRPAGAELPLFVVIGRDGKIAHYHAGLYPVDRNEGLRDLNAAVTKALGK